MKKTTLTATFALMIVLAMAVPAFATGASGAGAAYGQHVSSMTQESGGFTGTMNPGVMHQGFSGWTGM
jgi:hypothetical protein